MSHVNRFFAHRWQFQCEGVEDIKAINSFAKSEARLYPCKNITKDSGPRTILILVL